MPYSIGPYANKTKQNKKKTTTKKKNKTKNKFKKGLHENIYMNVRFTQSFKMARQFMLYRHSR